MDFEKSLIKDADEKYQKMLSNTTPAPLSEPVKVNDTAQYEEKLRKFKLRRKKEFDEFNKAVTDVHSAVASNLRQEARRKAARDASKARVRNFFVFLLVLALIGGIAYLAFTYLIYPNLDSGKRYAPEIVQKYEGTMSSTNKYYDDSDFTIEIVSCDAGGNVGGTLVINPDIIWAAGTRLAFTGKVEKISNKGTIKLELDVSPVELNYGEPPSAIKMTFSEEKTKIKFDIKGGSGECNDSLASSYTTTLESVLEGAAKNPDNGNYYRIISKQMTWEQAKAYCETLGGHLATVTNATENEFCYALFEESGVAQCYLGGEDLEIDGDWNWVTGEEWEYNSFHEGEPTGKQQNVLIYWDDYEDGLWDDIASGQSAVFMCEWEKEDISYVEKNYGKLLSTCWVYNGAFVFDGNVYNIFKNIASWDDATTFCTALGGQLAYISNDLENSALCAFVAERGSYSPVFGITDKDKEGKWVDANGIPTAYTNWADGEPNNTDKKEHYAHFKGTDGTWNDDAWTGEIICEWGDVSKLLSSPLNGAELNSANGNYYKIFSMKMTWEQAKAYCESVGGHLATVTNATENKFCYALFEKSAAVHCYLGGEDLEIDGDWNWITDEPWSYESFHEDEPSGKPQNVLIYWNNYEDGLWDDVASDQLVVFMCEWEKENISAVKAKF